MEYLWFLLLLVSGASGVTFRVTHQQLEMANTGMAGATWGNATAFDGIRNGERAIEMFVDGNRIASVNATFSSARTSCVATSAYPGIALFGCESTVEFFDFASRTFFPYNTSNGLPVKPNALVGSMDRPIAAAISQGGIHIIDTDTRTLTGTVIPIGNARYSAAAVRIADPNGTEYFAFVGAGNPTSDVISVLPTSAPTAFLPQVSHLTTARSVPICTVTTANVMVCIGGNDATGTKVLTADVCTIDAQGVFTCVSQNPGGSGTLFSPMTYVGPFLVVPRDNGGGDVVVADPSNLATNRKSVWTPPWFSWWSMGLSGGSRFAYLAGGSIGLQSYTRNVTVIECLPPCEPPLFTSATISGTVITNGLTLSSTSSSAVRADSSDSAQVSPWVLQFGIPFLAFLALV